MHVYIIYTHTHTQASILVHFAIVRVESHSRVELPLRVCHFAFKCMSHSY